MLSRRSRWLVAPLSLAVVPVTWGQVFPIPPYVGEFSEGFETQCPCPALFTCVPRGVFGGMGELCADQGFIANSYAGFCTLRPRSGAAFFGVFGRPLVGATFTFAVPVRRVGLWLAQAHGSRGGVAATLLDAAGVQIARVVVDLEGNCTWRWAGWESAVPIGGLHLLGFRVSAPFQVTSEFQVDDAQAGEAQGCYPDCDTTTGPGVLDIFDFLCFQNRYDVGAPYACDCDTSTGRGVCDIFDFLCFQNAFDAGCP